MKVAYVGIDLLYPALPALEEAGCELMRIFTCDTDNVTEFNTRVVGYAERRGIPLQKTRVTAADLEALVSQGCELLLCGGYYYKIPVRDDLCMVNIHPSPLPVGRGAWPMPVTILRGLGESGVTFHKLTPEMDAGDILLQEKLAVSPDETLETLSEKQRALLPGMVRRLVSALPELWNNAVPQDEARAEYWACPTEADWTIREEMPSEKIDRILRAFYGYEVIYENRAGERWELIEARLADCPDREKLCLPCGDRIIIAGSARRMNQQPPGIYGRII